MGLRITLEPSLKQKEGVLFRNLGAFKEGSTKYIQVNHGHHRKMQQRMLTHLHTMMVIRILHI